MNSQRGNRSRGDVSNKGKAIENSDSITHDMLGPGIENQQDDGWELVVSRKKRNQSGPASAPPPPPVHHPSRYGSATTQPRWGGNGSGRGCNSSGSGFVGLVGPSPNPWPVTPDPHKPGSQVNPRLQLQPPQEVVPPVSKSGVHPPLVGGWNWAARARVAVPQRNVEVVLRPPASEPEIRSAPANNDDSDDALQPLMTHAKMKGATAVKPHRDLSTILEEELGTPDIHVEGQCSEGQLSTSTNNIMLRMLVPSCKVGQLIGTGGTVIRDINTTYKCTLRVVHRFQEDSTAIILGKYEPDQKVPGAVDALLRVHRIITSQGQLRTAAAHRIVTRMLARMQHVTNFSGIAEECQTHIIIREDVRMSALPDDRIIEVSGEIDGVGRTVFMLSKYLCRFLLDDSIISLFFVEPKRHFRSISPLVNSWYHRLPFQYRSVADSIIDSINDDTGVIGVVQYDTRGLVVVEIIGKRVELQRAIEFFKRSMEHYTGLPIS